MPIKNPIKRREYQRELMRKKRSQGLTDKNVSPLLDLNLCVSPVSPDSEKLDQIVRPDNLVSPQLLDPVSPCSRCPELEQQIIQLKTEKNKQYERSRAD